MNERRANLDGLAIGLVALFCALWGLNQVAAKISNQSFSPLFQAGIRSTGAAILLYLWCVARGLPLFKRDGSLLPGIAAGLLFAAEFGLIFWALKYTTVSRGIIFLYTAPFVVAGGLHWLVPAERLRWMQFLGLVCAFAGIVAAFRESMADPGENAWIGDTMMLIAAIAWGTTTVIIRSSALSRVPPAKVLFYQLGISAVSLLAASFAFGEPGVTNPTAIGIASLVCQTTIVAFASYLGWFWLIAHYPASRLAAFTFLTPLFGMIFGAALLGEPVSPILGLALVLVAAGLWLVAQRTAAA